MDISYKPPEESEKNFLEVEDNPSFLRNLIVECSVSDSYMEPDIKEIKPIPGMCIKAKTSDDSKIFINICHCADIPKSSEEIQVDKILLQEADMIYLPLSVSEPHKELDKNGNPCTCYDIVVNSELYQSIQEKELTRDFIIAESCAALERKYNINVVIESCIPLKKAYHGKLPRHFIKVKPEDPTPSVIVPKDNVVCPVSGIMKPLQKKEIVYKLFRSPASGNPEILILQAIISGVANVEFLQVFISSNRVVVKEKNSERHIDVGLPYSILPKKSLANFFNDMLIVVMGILPEASRNVIS